MAVILDDREEARPLLMRDPIRNAVVVHRMFHHTKYALAFADALPEPKAVLALAPAQSAEEPHEFALHALEPMAALHVLRAVPKGAAVFHLADELAFPAVRERLAVDWWGEALYYRMEPETFVDHQTHEVRPVDAEHAEAIAQIWAPDWDAAPYVRSRIEEGPTAGIYVDGELVAWDMTHLETDEVVVMGFLHVMEGHRGKGYAKSASSALVKQIFAKGKVPTCHVYTDNDASIRLTESLGFQRVCIQAWGSGIAAR